MKLLALLASATLAGIALAAPAPAPGGPLADIAVQRIDGSVAMMKEWSGKVLLIVNVASECGYTGQYAGLEALHRKFKERGLVVMGFPCNQFGKQEPGSNAQIAEFCTKNFDVTFPMFAKVEVKGKGQHPLFARLTGKDSPHPGDIGWNFEKFLVGRDGKLLARFDAGEEPDSETLLKAVEAALKVK
jgi:glutathione peroxidase